jgi:hypothetical protein
MAYTRAHAQKLCTPAELELIVAAMRDAIGTLSAAQLRVRARRARALRDRHAALSKKQTAAVRAAAGVGRGATDANRRTQQKLALFEEALRRFEARLSSIESVAAKPVARVGRGGTPSAKASPRRAPAAPARPKKSAARRAAATQAAKAAREAANGAPTTPARTTKSATPAKARKPASPTRSAKAPAITPVSAKAPRTAKTGNPVSKQVRVRGKVIGSHVRAATARNQARRDGR